MKTLTEKQKFDNLIDVFLSIKNSADMKEFLYGILTEKELRELPNRLEIVRLLKKGISQHEISSTLKVGIGTITRGSKEIHKGRFKNI